MVCALALRRVKQNCCKKVRVGTRDSGERFCRGAIRAASNGLIYFAKVSIVTAVTTYRTTSEPQTDANTAVVESFSRCYQLK